MNKAVYFILVMSVGCNSYQEKDIAGLWKLDQVQFMDFERKFEQVILDIHENGSFAVTHPSKDFVGIYQINQDTLEFISDDTLWFNKKWILRVRERGISLYGIQSSLAKTTLTFRSLAKVPNLNVVEQQLIGKKWDLYKIRGNGKADQDLSNTFFHILDDGRYYIKNAHGLLEQGQMNINSRHSNAEFDNNNIVWDILVLGNEVRLTNEQTGLQYCLRAVKDGP